MKKLQVYSMVVLLVVAAACSLFKKDIEVPQTFSMKIDQPVGASLNFVKTQTVATSNSDIDKYKDQIDAFSVEKITYKVTQFAGTNSPVVGATLKFAAAGTTTFKTLGTITGLDLKASHTSGQEYTMALGSEEARNELVNLLKGNTDIAFSLEGQSSNNPVDATIEFKIYANMTVEL